MKSLIFTLKKIMFQEKTNNFLGKDKHIFMIQIMKKFMNRASHRFWPFTVK